MYLSDSVAKWNWRGLSCLSWEVILLSTRVSISFRLPSLYRRRHVSLKAAKSHYCIAVAVVSLLLSYLKFQFPLNGTSSRLHFSNGSIEFRTSVWKLKAMHLNLVIHWSKGTLSQLNLTWIFHYNSGGKSSLKWATDLASIDSASSQRRKEREWRGQSYYPRLESEVNVFQFRILVTTFYIYEHVHLQFEKWSKIRIETLRTGPTYDEIISCGIQETEWTFQETGRGCIQDLGQNERKLAMKWNAFFLPSPVASTWNSNPSVSSCS